MINIHNIDARHAPFESNSVDLGIFDPPFGINESQFDKHYKRDNSVVLPGYVEAPNDYYQFSIEWLSQAKRILKPDGSMYVISGWTNLKDMLMALDTLELETINHIIWKYNFGVSTRKKYVSSHYHILYIKKPGGKVKFNTYSRYGVQEKDDFGGSLLYQDLEDVWYIKKDYAPGQIKNGNKLPDELIRKMILYSSSPDDIVLDFFQGNFTTAYNALALGRHAYGTELNKVAYDYHIPKLKQLRYGYALEGLKSVENAVPINQGKPITDDERAAIVNYVKDQRMQGKTKATAIDLATKLFGRGKFSIINILEKG